jgi:hypothetical protein
MVDEQAASVWAKKLIEKFERDPTLAHVLFGHTGNPYYAWSAIGDCIKHKMEFPEWLIEYLGQCAERMLSDEARAASDLRKVLPSIFGFPRKSSGPGRLLDPDTDPRDTLSFALRFLRKVAEGHELPDALKEASIDTNCECADDKTLKHWVCENFGLKSWPRDRAQFIEMTREPMLALRRLLEVRE